MNRVEKRGWPVCVYVCICVCVNARVRVDEKEEWVVGERGGRREEEAVTAITV